MADEHTQPFFDKRRNTGLTHLVNATRFSVKGVVEALKREAAFRQEIIALIVLTPVAMWIAETTVDFVVLMAIGGMVLIVELLNSAIEACVDRIGTDHHEMAGLAKDYGSAAVMISLMVAVAVWGAYLFQRLNG